jgi:demethylmenaquinone methyltransferase/2-methoxy-6-polyprenyl-1,4-benzoquinol methylase
MSSSADGHHESNRAFYDRISGAYDLMSDASERAARVRGLELLTLQAGEHVLELGYGTGNELIDLANAVGPTGRVVGIDISTGMKRVAERKLERAGAAVPVELQVADARTLSFEDGSFDAVYSSFTLELFPEEDLPIVLSEVRRVMKPGGRVGVVSMARVKRGNPTSALEYAYIWMHRHFPHIVDCRPIDVEATLESGGLAPSRSESLDIWTLPVTAAVATKEAG